MTPTDVPTLIANALTTLQGQVPGVITGALALAVMVFGGKYLWHTAKGFVR